MWNFLKKTRFWGVVALVGLGLAWTPIGATEEKDSVGSATNEGQLDTSQLDAMELDTMQLGSIQSDAMDLGPSGEVGYGMLLVKLGLGLALVVFLAWGSVLLLRKSAFGQQYSGVGSAVKVVERTFLAPRKAVYLVEVGQRVLALGVTEEQITRLAEWGAGEVELTPAKTQADSFTEQFKNIIAQKKKRGE